MVTAETRFPRDHPRDGIYSTYYPESLLNLLLNNDNNAVSIFHCQIGCALKKLTVKFVLIFSH